MRQGLWGIVSGRTKKPVQTSTTPLTATESAAITTWEDKAEKAARELYLLVSDEQKVHFAGISDDPCAMWKKLESIHLQKRPGARFNAYDVLFSIRKASDESLTALMTRVDAAMQKIQNLRSDGFTLDQMDRELVCMVLIKALPEEYASFASSLQLLDKFNKEKIQEAFVAEELLRSRNAEATALSSTPSSSALAAGQPQSGTSSFVCDFCGTPGHSQARCFRYRAAKLKAGQETLADDQEQRRKYHSKANKSNTSANSASGTPESAAAVKEYAGKASLRSNTPSNASTSNTDAIWTADTEANAHMTRFWLRDYTPQRIPIRLANNTIVYSAGVGSMLFAPEDRWVWRATGIVL